MRLTPPEKPEGYSDIVPSRYDSETDPISFSTNDNDNRDNRSGIVNESDSHSEWGALPVTDTRVPLPLDHLPKHFANYVQAVAEAIQVPVDMPHMVALVVLAGATRGRFLVNVSEGHTEPLSLFAAAFMEPGERKSSVRKRVAEPLRKAEVELIQAATPQVKESQERHEYLQARVKKARAKAVNSPDDSDTQAEYDEAQGELNSFVPAVSPRIMVGDITPESLATELSRQQGSLTHLSDEGGLIKNLAGRYNEGNANLDVVNHAYSGEGITVDRQGREPIVIDRAHLALGLVVQPDVLREMKSNGEMKGRGFLDRFLFAVPISRVGTRQYQGQPVPLQFSEYWERQVKAIVREATQLHNLNESRALTLTPEAVELHRPWWESMESRLRDEGDLPSHRSWVSKFASGTVVRLAALFALFDSPQASKVQVEHMHAALSLTDYYLGQVQFVFGSPVVGNGAKVLAAIQKVGQAQFTARQIHRKVQGQAWCKAAQDVETELIHLQRAGYVRRADSTGTKSDIWECHPDLI